MASSDFAARLPLATVAMAVHIILKVVTRIAMSNGARAINGTLLSRNFIAGVRLAEAVRRMTDCGLLDIFAINVFSGMILFKLEVDDELPTSTVHFN